MHRLLTILLFSFLFFDALSKAPKFQRAPDEPAAHPWRPLAPKAPTNGD